MDIVNVCCGVCFGMATAFTIEGKWSDALVSLVAAFFIACVISGAR